MSEKGASRKEQVYGYIREYFGKYRCGPTFREVAESVGVGLTSVNTHIHTLLDEGRLVRAGNPDGGNKPFRGIIPADPYPTCLDLLQRIEEEAECQCISALGTECRRCVALSVIREKLGAIQAA